MDCLCAWCCNWLFCWMCKRARWSLVHIHSGTGNVSMISEENKKWLIFGVCIIIATIIYVFGTRYRAYSYHGQIKVVDRFTGFVEKK